MAITNLNNFYSNVMARDKIWAYETFPKNFALVFLRKSAPVNGISRGKQRLKFKAFNKPGSWYRTIVNKKNPTEIQIWLAEIFPPIFWLANFESPGACMHNAYRACAAQRVLVLINKQINEILKSQILGEKSLEKTSWILKN